MNQLAKNVTLIPAKKGKTAKGLTRKYRVAAYCRVSTDSDEQLNSYKNQLEYYTNKISSNPDWEPVEVFADEGITGTSTKKRDEFNRMIEMCKAGKIDIILTKSVHRFARNTLDSIKYVRMLRALNVNVIFEMEGVQGIDPKDEQFLVIHASMAQSYSQKLSEDVKWGFRKSFAQGKAYFGGRFYGYRMAGEGKVEIIPEQAEIVKQIFQMYLDGSTSRKIAQTLTRRGVLNASGNIRWDSTAIDRMLANEKYMGDALSQKTFIADVLEKKPQKNTGQLPQYYVTDNHEAIIPREMFKRVQFERARRGSLEPKGTKTKTNAGRFRPQYVLTEILLCGECGEHYRRCTWARNGKKKVVWRCINRLENGKRNCRESPTLDEGVLHDAILGFLRNLQSPRDELVQNLLEYTEESLEQKTGDSKKQKLLDMLEQKNRLLQEMLSLDIVPDEKIERLSREYDEIQEQIDSLGDVQNGMEQENAYIRGIKEYMETADFNRYEFDDKLIRQVIEQVIVKNADTLYIRMKGGYEAEIKLPNV